MHNTVDLYDHVSEIKFQYEPDIISRICSYVSLMMSIYSYLLCIEVKSYGPNRVLSSKLFSRHNYLDQGRTNMKNLKISLKRSGNSRDRVAVR